MSSKIGIYPLIFLVVGLIAGIIISGSYYQGRINTLEVERDDMKASLDKLDASINFPELPEGAVKLSPVVPGMGEHWAVPSQLPTGPIYMVYEGRVIGVEFMVKSEWMSKAQPGPDTMRVLTGDTKINALVDHITIEYLEHGHEGAEEPHYDMHLYFITEDERQNIR